jgi:uncharacterized protein (DUF2236 family)
VTAMFNVRERIARSVSDLFTHAEYPLTDSLSYEGDPGLFGPGSSTWEVIGDVSAMVGGIRALLIQTAHPEVVAGVADHSEYRADPLGRLSRTSAYVTATAYGAKPEVQASIDTVFGAHAPVTGVSHRGRPYSANHGGHASWVHNVLTDSFLTAYQTFAPTPLDTERSDAFVVEQAELGSRLRANDLPLQHGTLAQWVDTHEALEASSAMTNALTFLKNPPLPAAARVGYRILLNGAAAAIPPRVTNILGLEPPRGSLVLARKLLALMRWSMGSSPSWWLALERTHEDPPAGVRFRRPPPATGAAERFTAR